MKENDLDEADGMKQEIDAKDRLMPVAVLGLVQVCHGLPTPATGPPT